MRMEEPARKSFLDTVRHDLSLAGRRSFLTRFVYIGEYKGTTSDALNMFKKNVKDLSGQYGEAISGLLLLYPKCFLHLVEASEETIYKHLSALLSSSSSSFGRVLALPAYYHGCKVYFPGWFVAQIPKPPFLLEKIEKTDLDIVEKHMQNCLLKMYSLCEVLTDTRSDGTGNIKEAVKNLDTIAPHLLPEFTLVEYLLSVQSSALDDVARYLLKFNRLPLVNLFNDRVWPPTREIVPRDLLLSTKKPTRE